MPPTYLKATNLEQLYHAIVQIQLSNTYYEITEIETKKKKLRLKTQSSKPVEEMIVKEKQLKKKNDVTKFFSGFIMKHQDQYYALTETNILLNSVKGVNIVKLKFIV